VAELDAIIERLSFLVNSLFANVNCARAKSFGRIDAIINIKKPVLKGLRHSEPV